MKILSIRTIPGPNVYHHKPVLMMSLDLEEMTEKASTDSDHFTQDLLKVLPQLREHHCSPGRPGGFVERLERGTYFAHIIEHMSLVISEMAGIGVGFGKAVYNGAPGCYKIVIRYKSEEGMKLVLRRASELALAIWNKTPFDLQAAINEIRECVRRHELGPSTKSIVEAAEKRNIPWRRIDEMSFIQLGWGKYRKFRSRTGHSTFNL